MPRQMNRIVPKSGPENYKTFGIYKPRETHTRPGTCEEYGCENYLVGWTNRVPLSDIKTLEWLRSSACTSRWKYTERRENNEILFMFPAGQRCFKFDKHRVSLDRPELYVVKGGDWRGDPRQETPRVHTKPENWVEDMQENLEQVRKDREG